MASRESKGEKPLYAAEPLKKLCRKITTSLGQKEVLPSVQSA